MSDTSLSVSAITTRRQGVVRRFCQQKAAVFGALLLLTFILLALAAPLIAPFDPFKTDFGVILSPPDRLHLLGTDELGRDLLSRVLFGLRISLIEGFVPVSLAMLLGVPIGIAAGYGGGMLDKVVMRLIDVLLAFPGVLLAIVIVSVLGPGLQNALLAVAIYTTPIFARLARGGALAVSTETYVEACRVMGMSHLRICWRHILPNMLTTLLVVATLRVGLAILTVASLSFLGLGAQPPSPELGAMLSKGRSFVMVQPHMVIVPGVTIVLLVLALNLFQNGLRVALDPKSS